MRATVSDVRPEWAPTANALAEEITPVSSCGPVTELLEIQRISMYELICRLDNIAKNISKNDARIEEILNKPEDGTIATNVAMTNEQIIICLNIVSYIEDKLGVRKK